MSSEQQITASAPKDGEGAVLVITGPSGVGKGTLIKRLLAARPQLKLAVSATTRSPREGEQDGRDYYFKTDEQFTKLIEQDEFAEWAAYSDNRYGTLKSELAQKSSAGGVVLEIELEGARQIRESMPGARLIFIAPPKFSDLEERLVGRATDERAQIERRLEVARKELAAQDEFERVVVNDQLERATAELLEVVDSRLNA